MASLNTRTARYVRGEQGTRLIYFNRGTDEWRWYEAGPHEEGSRRLGDTSLSAIGAAYGPGVLGWAARVQLQAVDELLRRVARLRAQWRRDSRSVARRADAPMRQAGLWAGELGILVQGWLSAEREHGRDGGQAVDLAWQTVIGRPPAEQVAEWSRDWRSGDDHRRIYLDVHEWEWRVDYNPATPGRTVGRLSLHHLFTSYEPQLRPWLTAVHLSAVERLLTELAAATAAWRRSSRSVVHRDVGALLNIDRLARRFGTLTFDWTSTRNVLFDEEEGLA